MKCLVFMTSILAVAFAQRPGYLGSAPVGYPGLASRFQTGNSQAAASTPNVNNRLGESDGTTPKIPIDARGDAALVNRVNQWPREHRPFWVLNAEHIEAQRNTPTQQQQQQPTDLQQRFGDNLDSAQDFSVVNGIRYDNFGNPVDTQPIRPAQTRGSFAG